MQSAQVDNVPRNADWLISAPHCLRKIVLTRGDAMTDVRVFWRAGGQKGNIRRLTLLEGVSHLADHILLGEHFLTWRRLHHYGFCQALRPTLSISVHLVSN